VFVAMVTSNSGPGQSRFFCPNTQQSVDVPGIIDDCVVCCRSLAGSMHSPHDAAAR
jgi:hypothetical protein